ncbi:AraC family transcriptional regulator [Pontivivens ytuae]|uniref:Helix-turn-helix transcriptional regulator n=1 Tax=Pontivivens ytuae TaxID=2789856 RepID=A0A7S9QDA2_9RHOB|nr:AraC family transcriptional regulator [Pontivivens ytuae]QPH53931.1 helix-turn-helix transcriptional regulator [Pontivivens ytuae]
MEAGELETIALLVRGGGAALTLFLAVRFALMGCRTVVDTAGFLFCAFATLHTLGMVATPSGYGLDTLSWAGLAHLAGRLDTVAFWVMAMAMFDDRFRLQNWHFAPGVLMLTLTLIPGTEGLCALLVVVLMLHVMVLGLRDLDGDLVDLRRRLRMALAFLVPAMVISSTLMNTVLTEPGPWVDLFEASKFALLSFLFAVWLTRMEEGLIASPDPEEPRRTPPLPAADRLELDQLTRAVAEGVCFEPGLTIGALAQRLEMPEHRLRRLINQGLGYRNFAAFLNDHRVEEAKRRLADPSQARAQIISHAFALGYNSLAPFNRAFRERVGESPSAFRNRVLEDAVA